MSNQKNQPYTKIKWLSALLAVFAFSTAAAAPNAPSSLSLSVPESGTLTLQWSDNSNNESAFYAYYRLSSTSSLSYLGYAPANSTSLTKTGLSCGSYEVVVFAYSNGWSPMSNMETANPCTVDAPNPGGGGGASCDTLYGGSLQNIHSFSYTSQSLEVINVSICASANYQANAYGGNLSAAIFDMQETIIETDTALFNLLGPSFSKTPVSGGSTKDVVVALYASEAEYLAQGLIANASGFYSSSDHSLYPDNTIYTFDRLPSDTVNPAFALTISHEYVHYLLWRYMISGDYGDYADPNDDVGFVYYPAWVDEGVAEYVGYQVVFGSPFSAFTEFYPYWDKCDTSYDQIHEGLILDYAESTALIYYMFSVQNVNKSTFFNLVKSTLLDGVYNHAAGDYTLLKNYLNAQGINASTFGAWLTATFDNPDNGYNSCDQSPTPPPPPTGCGPNQVCIIDNATGETQTLTGPGWVYLSSIGWENRADGIINNTSSNAYLYDYGGAGAITVPGTSSKSDLGTYNNRADAVYVP